MVDNTIEPTAPQNEPVVEPTATEPVKTPDKTFTQTELDQLIKERLERERKKYAGFDDLKAKAAKLDEIEAAKKTDEEKALAKLKELEDKIAEKEAAILKAELREKKRSALDSAGLNLPSDVSISELLDMMPGGEDDIEDYIAKFKRMFPASAPEPTKPTGLGTSTKTGEPAQKKSLADELRDVTAKLTDPKTTRNERDALIDRSNQLQRRISKGET